MVGVEIMDFIARKLKVVKAVALVTYKEWSAYRTHSMVSIFVGPVYFIVQYFIWSAVYSRRTYLNGMELSEMLTYFGVTTLIGYITMDFADWNLQMLVRTGKFLTFAIRPIHHRFFALSQKIGHRILGLFFEFIPCLFIFVFIFKVDLRPASYFWTIISVALAFLMNLYMNYTIGLTAFWLVQATGVRRVYLLLQGIFSGGLIPLVFFPKALQKLLLFLPFQYVSYVPAMVYIGRYTLADVSVPIPHIVGLQAVAVIVTALFSELVYRLSMKRFSGVGA
jgi:ABC-2 type transport system permease protein